MQTLRFAESHDGDALAEIYRPAVAERATSFELDPPDGAEMARRVATTLERLPWLVCQRDGNVVGYAYASRYRDRAAYQWSVEVSAYVHESRHRRGVGRALYSALFRVLALQGYYNAYAGITLPNPASVGFHTAFGFTPVGVFHRVGWKFGQWHDVMWLERAVQTDVGPPTVPPSPIVEWLGSAALDAALRGSPPSPPC
jgi:phosphinothricin acetyltransferase